MAKRAKYESEVPQESFGPASVGNTPCSEKSILFNMNTKGGRFENNLLLYEKLLQRGR